VVSQLPVVHWHDALCDLTLTDADLGRLFSMPISSTWLAGSLR